MFWKRFLCTYGRAFHLLVVFLIDVQYGASHQSRGYPEMKEVHMLKYTRSLRVYELAQRSWSAFYRILHIMRASRTPWIAVQSIYLLKSFF